VTEGSLVNQREALRIVSARLDAGRGTQLDVARARTWLPARSRLRFKTTMERTVFRLATLTVSPRRVSAELTPAGERAAMPSPVTDLLSAPLGYHRTMAAAPS
jgi:multidrug efflux system outer membrane protein